MKVFPKEYCIAGIYGIINKANNKIYIGSAVNLRKRLLKHRWLLRNNNHNNRHLQKSYNKYGEDNFKIVLLHLVAKHDDLIKYEQCFINTFDSCNKNNGYNLCPVAYSSLGLKHSEKAKQNMCLANIKRHGKPVLMLDENDNILREFSSIGRAEYELKISKGHISRCCRGIKVKRAGGFKWRYKVG